MNILKMVNVITNGTVNFKIWIEKNKWIKQQLISNKNYCFISKLVANKYLHAKIIFKQSNEIIENKY